MTTSQLCLSHWTQLHAYHTVRIRNIRSQAISLLISCLLHRACSLHIHLHENTPSPSSLISPPAAGGGSTATGTAAETGERSSRTHQPCSRHSRLARRHAIFTLQHGRHLHAALSSRWWPIPLAMSQARRPAACLPLSFRGVRACGPH